MTRSAPSFVTTFATASAVALVSALVSASLIGGTANAESPGVIDLADGLVEHTGGWEVANAEVHQQGRLVSALIGHRGQIFAGHGNYSANSGSTPVNDGTDIGSYDPITQGHVRQMAGFTTEEVKVFREINGDLYAPNIDPTTADADQPYVTNASGTWGYAGEPVTGAIHIYDMAELDGEWFLFGAAWTGTRGQAGTVQAAATIWTSPDGLTDWTVAHQAQESVADYDGYERFYWGATEGDTLYAAATAGIRGATPPVVQYKDGVWSDAPASSPANSYLDYVGAQYVFSTDHGVVFANGDQINVLRDGEFTTVKMPEGEYIQTATRDGEGDLYLLSSSGAILQVDPATMSLVTIWQGTDPVLGSVMAMAVLDSTVYFAAISPDANSNRMITLTLSGSPSDPGAGENPSDPGVCEDKVRPGKHGHGKHKHKHAHVKHGHGHGSHCKPRTKK